MKAVIQDKLGRPIRDLRISVTDRCNFRCDYCMPKEIFGDDYTFLPKDELRTFEELTRISKIYAQLGVKKIRITGGEPLLREGLDVFVKMIFDYKNDIDLALSINGKPKKVEAHGYVKDGMAEYARAIITHENGSFSNIVASRITEKRLCAYGRIG